MAKNFLLGCFVALGLTSALWAEQLSKIGMVNFSKIIDDYFAESAAWREIDAMRNQYNEGKENILEEIDQMGLKKLTAQAEGDEHQVLQLEEQIYQKQEYLKEYHSIWQSRINAKVESVSSSSSFTAEIYQAVKYIAESEGYSVIIRTRDPDVLYYNQEVDITNLVLERLRQQAAGFR